MIKFVKINHKINSDVLNHLLTLAKENSGYDIVTSKYSRVKLLDNNSYIFESDPLLKWIKQTYNNFLYMIFKSPPNYCINYHIDDKRFFGLNISLTEYASVNYGECDEETFNRALTNKKLPSFWNLENHKYEVGVPYIANTKVYHSTSNISSSDRYMLTFTFPNVQLHNFMDSFDLFKYEVIS